MTTLARVRVIWSGSGINGSGLSTFYTTGPGSDLSDDLFTFFDSIKGAFPNDVTWTIPTTGDTIDDNTTELNGTWSGGTGGTVVGANAEGYAMGVGARIVWATSGITNGRHVRGSTYLCPLAGAAYENNGTINDSTLTLLYGQANALLAAQAGGLSIVRRATPALNGTSWPVEGLSVPDQVSWLRTRRT